MLMFSNAFCVAKQNMQNKPTFASEKSCKDLHLTAWYSCISLTKLPSVTILLSNDAKIIKFAQM